MTAGRGAAQWGFIAAALLAGCRKPSPPELAAQPQVEAPAPPVAPAKLPKLDVAASVVSVLCGDEAGAGFFVSESQVLTRAHFLCERHEPPRVKLPDERTLLGTVKWKDEVLDAALVEVEGGDGVPLPAGDAAAVALSGLLGQGKLQDDSYSELARFYFVIEYPGAPPPEGSPVVDEQGRAVAMVARSVGERRMLALPLPVVAEAGSGLPPPSGKWATVEMRARGVAQAELDAATEVLGRVMLATAVLDGEGHLFVQVLHRANAPAAPFTLVLPGCSTDVESAAWVPFDEDAAVDLASRRLFTYLARTRLDAGLQMAMLQLDGCPRVTRGQGVVVGHGVPTHFEEGTVGKVARTLEVTHTVASVAVPVDPRALPKVARGRQEGGAEGQWRQRYREARRRISDVERELEEERHFVQWADHHGNNPRMVGWQLSAADREHYDAAKEKLAHADELRAQARAALDELDRQAANAAVPLEWRH